MPKEELPKGEERSKVVVKSTDMHAEEMVVELDDWLIDFANLFRDHLGIDPDKCVTVPFLLPCSPNCVFLNCTAMTHAIQLQL